MFSYTGLSEKVCEILTKKYHIYLLKSGRISMAGVNKKNVKYLAQSIKAALLDAQK
jgi:aspartate aminotransferase